jgi:glycosyltransferase involved in cell wall biosynthesis
MKKPSHSSSDWLKSFPANRILLKKSRAITVATTSAFRGKSIRGVLASAWKILALRGPSGVLAAIKTVRESSLTGLKAHGMLQAVPILPTVSIILGDELVTPALSCFLEDLQKSNSSSSWEVVISTSLSTELKLEENQFRTFPGSAKDLGVVELVNRAVNAARGQYIVLIQKDPKIDGSWLDPLLLNAETHPDYAILSPVPNVDSDEVVSAVDSLDSPVVLIRREVFDHLGGLSSSYASLYWSMEDFFLRARLAGYSIGVYRGQCNKIASFTNALGENLTKTSPDWHTFYERNAGFALRRSILPKPRSGAPMISVILRTKNRPGLLKDALASLANQTFSPFEVVVVNDGGEDIVSVLSRYQNCLKIEYVHHETSRGRTAALNSGILHSKGEYINYLDDDDLVYPFHLDLLNAAVNSSACPEVVYSMVNRVLCRENLTGETVLSRVPIPSFDFNSREFLIQNKVPILAVMNRRSCFDVVGFFDEEFDLFEDWEFLLRLSQRYEFFPVRKITCEYRFRLSRSIKNSITQNRSEVLQSMLQVYEKHPVGAPDLLEKRKNFIEMMREQVGEIEKIRQAYGNSLESEELSIMRSAGFTASEIMQGGLRN